MTRGFTICFALTLLMAVGCSQKIAQREPIELPPLTPLAVEEWKAMTDIDRKYEPTTLDRLRLHDEKLQNEARWNLFMRQVVGPERRKDIPLTTVSKTSSS